MSGSEVRINLFHGDRLEYRFCSPSWRQSRQAVPWPALVEALDTVDPRRCQRLLLGESPLSHPRFDDFVALCRERKIKGLSIETDAPALAQEGVLEELKTKGIEKIFAVVGGARRRVYDAAMQTDGDFASAMEGLRRAAKSTLELYVVVPLLRWTVDDVSALLDGLLGFEKKPRGYLLALPEVAQVPEVMRKTLLSYGEAAVAAARVFDVCRRYRIEWGFTLKRGILPCAARGALDRFGTVFYDRMSWLRHAHEEKFVRVPECQSCSLEQSCPGVEPEYLAHFGAEGLSPIDLEVSMDWNLKRANTLEKRDFKNVSEFDNDTVGNGRSLLRINGHCNMSCAFCFVDRTVPDFDADELAAQITRMAEHDPSHLVLSGGEPTLHPALPRLIAHAKNLGFRTIEIQSNGVKAAEFGYAKRLAEAGLNKITVSLHSTDPERSDKITRLTGGFAKTVAAMENFRRLGVLTQVAHVITKANYEELPTTVRFLREKFREDEGHLSICFGVAQPISDLVYTWVMPTFDEIKPYMRAALDYCLEEKVGFGGMIGQGGYPPCMLDGEMKYYGANLGNIYRSSDWDEQFVKPDKCRQCSFDPWCLGVRRLYVETYGDAEIKPFSAVIPGAAMAHDTPTVRVTEQLVTLRAHRGANT